MITRLLFFVLLTVPVAFAQSASVTGRVADASGAVVQRAVIKITNEDTGAAREVQSNDVGYFLASQLIPGNYVVEVSAPGFRPVRQSGIKLDVAQTARLDFSLEVGATTESINVSSAAPLIESESAAVGQVIENKRVIDLPLRGRQFMEFALLGPGVNSGRPGDRRASQQGFALSANGLYAAFNNYMLDGADNNESYQNQFVTAPSVDAIAEFKVQTGLYPAEFGRGGGAVINVVTKSGTNQFHGVLFEFLRNNRLDARNFFDIAPRPPLRRNQFGGSLGGPVIKDRTHFFFNYDATLIRNTASRNAVVPNAAQRQGILTGDRFTIRDPITRQPFANNIVPSNRISAVSRNFLEFWPLPNLEGQPRNFIYNGVNKDDQRTWIARIDHTFSAKDNVNGRYTENVNESAGAGALPAAGGSIADDRNRSAMLNWNRIFSPSLLNSLRLGFNRFVQDARGQNNGTPVAANAGVTGISTNPRDYGFPTSVNFNAGYGFTSLGEGAVRIRRVNTYQILDSFDYVRGRHVMKWGGEVRSIQANIFQTEGTQGQFTFNGQYTATGYTDFLLGIPSATNVSVNAQLVYPRRNSFAFFFQDDWKVTPNLTLNLGIRYELNLAVSEARHKLSGFDHATGAVLFPRDADIGDFYTAIRPDLRYRKFDTNTLYDNDLNNWGPRIGIAWRPFDAKTVIRAGFGIYYNSPELNSEQNTGNTPPFQLRIDEVGNQQTPNLSWALSGNLNNLRNVLFGIFTYNGNRDFTTGYVMQWMFDVQRELPKGLVFKSGYVANRGVKIDQRFARNQLPPGPGAATTRRIFREWARVITYESAGLSSYHSLQTSLEKRFSSGLSFLTAYTFGKSIDLGTTDGCCQLDIDNLNRDRALSGQDQRRRFTANWLYELPIGKGKRLLPDLNPVADRILGGWRVGGLATLQSGFPTSPAVAGNLDNVPDNTDRPDRVGPHEVADPRPDRYWDPAGFRVNQQFQFGTSGRNVLTLPGVVNFDFVIGKNTRIRENHLLEFRAELFSAFNHPNFGAPVNNISNVTFGQIFSASGSRTIQLGLKYYF